MPLDSEKSPNVDSVKIFFMRYSKISTHTAVNPKVLNSDKKKTVSVYCKHVIRATISESNLARCATYLATSYLGSAKGSSTVLTLERQSTIGASGNTVIDEMAISLSPRK